MDGSIVKIDFDLSTGNDTIVSTWAGQHENGVTALALLDDGRTVISSSGDTTLKFWDSSDGTCLATTLFGHSSYLTCLALLPSLQQSEEEVQHQLAVSGSYDNTLIIWDMIERRHIKTLTGHTEGVMSVACLTHNKIVSGSDDKSIRLWDIVNGACLSVMNNGHSNFVYSLVALSSDVIASAGSYIRISSYGRLAPGSNCKPFYQDIVKVFVV